MHDSLLLMINSLTCSFDDTAWTVSRRTRTRSRLGGAQTSWHATPLQATSGRYFASKISIRRDFFASWGAAGIMTSRRRYGTAVAFK